MKTLKILSLFILISFMSLDTWAQMIVVNEENITINKKPTSAWTSIIDMDIEDVKSSFIDFSKEVYELSARKKGKRTLVIEQASLPSISDKQGDLWVVFYPEGDDIKMGIAYFFGYDISLNSQDYPEEMQKLKNFSREFIVYYKSGRLNQLISEDEKRINSLNEEQARNQRELESLIKSSTKLEKSILKEKDEQKKFDQTNKNIELKAKIQAAQDISGNLKDELVKVTESLNSTLGILKQLESEAFQLQSLD